MRLDSGEEWGRASDVPVSAGATELLLALPASAIRKAPARPMRLTLRSSSGSDAANVLAEYVFHHEGAHDRSGASTEQNP
jgi:hypothetical protein